MDPNDQKLFEISKTYANGFDPGAFDLIDQTKVSFVVTYGDQGNSETLEKSFELNRMVNILGLHPLQQVIYHVKADRQLYLTGDRDEDNEKLSMSSAVIRILLLTTNKNIDVPFDVPKEDDKVCSICSTCEASIWSVSFPAIVLDTVRIGIANGNTFQGCKYVDLETGLLLTQLKKNVQ
jgi:hypothetical protein